VAQRKIIVQGTYPNLFIYHKVSLKEDLYNIGKLYNVTAAQLANANKMSETDVLPLDKNIKIPLTKKNFTQDGQRGEGEALIPLYHIVVKGENIYRISVNYGTLRPDFFREWNDLNNESIVQPQQKVVIGHLKVSQERANDILDNSPLPIDEDGYGPDAKPETSPVAVTPTRNDSSDEGFFANDFSSTTTGKEHLLLNGDAAIIKTTSGWTDRKYYVLMDGVTPNTIIRITASNGRSVCAKVLGPIPTMKDGNNLMLRISNAAVAALGIGDAKFSVSVGYYK
jgi:LysM repeat protein